MLRKKVFKVTTTRVLFHLERLDKILIQLLAINAPFNDLPWNIVASDYCEVKTSKQIYANIGDIGDDSSEENYLQCESEEYALNYFFVLLNRPEREISIKDSSEEFEVAIDESDPEDRSKTIAADFPVCCPVDNCGYRSIGLRVG